MSCCGSCSQCEKRSKECIECQFCCTMENVPIPGGMKYVYLYYRKGHHVYWEPRDGKWYCLFEAPCRHITDSGCMIYEDRPELCRTWYCGIGKRIWKRYNALTRAGVNIIQRLEYRGNLS